MYKSLIPKLLTKGNNIWDLLRNIFALSEDLEVAYPNEMTRGLQRTNFTFIHLYVFKASTELKLLEYFK